MKLMCRGGYISKYDAGLEIPFHWYIYDTVSTQKKREKGVRSSFIHLRQSWCQEKVTGKSVNGGACTHIRPGGSIPKGDVGLDDSFHRLYMKSNIDTKIMSQSQLLHLAPGSGRLYIETNRVCRNYWRAIREVSKHALYTSEVLCAIDSQTR